MENKSLSRILFIISTLLFVVTIYFVYGMFSNGDPGALDPNQMGLELVEQGKDAEADYYTVGQEAYEKQVSKIGNNIQSGIVFMYIMLAIAGISMIIFLLWGVIKTMMTSVKKALPSLVFVGITLITIIVGYLFSSESTEGFEGVVRTYGEDAGSVMATTTFWVYGILSLFFAGILILIVDLLVGIIKGFTK